jgi:RES domain-containing protein
LKSIFRISSSRYPADSAAGSALFGGRWNRIGTGVIYAAETASLAALEVLVHYSVVPRDHVLTEILIPDTTTIVRWKLKVLPAGWNSEMLIPETQDLGDRWVRSGKSSILEVPSSVIPFERNFVINPSHPDFSALKFKRSVPFEFDPRLKR